MNKKVIKFIKNNWLYVLFLFFIMSIGYFLGSSFRVDAYQLDSNGNITSDNICVDCPTSISIGSGYETWYYSNLNNYGVSFVEGATYTIKAFGDFSSYGLVAQLPGLGYSTISNDVRTFVYNSSLDLGIRIGSNGYHDTIVNFNPKIVIVNGDASSMVSSYVPYDVWFSSSNVDVLLNGYLNISSISATWNGGSLSDASSYVYNKDGLVWVDGIFDYISNNSSDGSYTNSDVTILFGSRMPTNINYSYSFIGSIGSSISFYQGNTMIYSINVTDGTSDLCSSVPSSNLCVINLSDKINFNDYTYFDKVVLWSSNYDHKPLSFGYYSFSYYSGYNKGYIDGSAVGYSNGYNDGNSDGYNQGYDIGFNAGLEHDGNYGPNTLVGMIGAIFTGPVNMMQSIFDFEFLGINLSQFFFSLISLLVVVWLIIKFL